MSSFPRPDLPTLGTRIREILLRPQGAWPAIEGESTSHERLYKQWLIWLAAIGPLAAFIAWSLLGVGIRLPLWRGLAYAVTAYVVWLVGVYVLAAAVDALAPTFGSRRDKLAALKLVAYGLTPSMVAGITHLLPGVGLVDIAAALYSFYLMYLGLPVLMNTPRDRAVGYACTIAVCGLAIGFVGGLFTVPFVAPVVAGMR